MRRCFQKRWVLWIECLSTGSGLLGSVAKTACQCWRPGFDLWVGKTAWRRKRLPAPVYLPGNLHGQRSLEGCIPWGGKRVSHNWATKRQAQGPMPKKNDNRDVVTWSYSLTEAIRSGWSNTRSSLWSPAHSTQFRWHHTFQLAVAASNLEAKPDHWKDFFFATVTTTLVHPTIWQQKELIIFLLKGRYNPNNQYQYRDLSPPDSHFPLGLSLTATKCNGLIPDWNMAQAIWSVVSTANRWRWRPWVKALTSNSRH